MNKRYSILLLISGAGWFLIAAVVGPLFSVVGGRWIQNLVCAILAAFVVGIAFRVPILRWSGWRWYLLPILTLLTGTAFYGFLFTCCWYLAGLRPEGWESDTFYLLPLTIVFYSMTLFLPVLYPLALLTQHLLRRGMNVGDAGPGASGFRRSA